jgi:hypothetical protein
MAQEQWSGGSLAGTTGGSTQDNTMRFVPFTLKRRVILPIIPYALGLLLIGWNCVAYADKFSTSYLLLQVTDQRINGQWDIALRDLDMAVGLDQDGNGQITWNEVHNRQGEISAYALSHLGLVSNGGTCTPVVRQQLISNHSDGAYSVLRFTAICPSMIKKLTVAYNLLFQRDPQHKGLLRLQTPLGISTAVFSADHSEESFTLQKTSAFVQFREFVKTGIDHIWSGFDHLLFLFSLLLPAVFIWVGKSWQPAENFKTAFIDVLKIVTAFTLAHSITLTLATLHIVALPSRWVESGIAASVVIAALNNLFTVVHGRRWLVAFGFGLIHGFGFATVLTDLGLPRSVLALALVGFNLGVEIGQLSIVAAFLPIAFALRRTWFYRKMLFVVGSAAIITVASVWFIERAFNLKLISS